MRHYSTSSSTAMPPRRGLASTAAASASYSLVSNAAHTREAYRDLLIFEERLKQNSERLASQRRKYEAFLLSLILSITFLAYRVFITPSPYTILQFLNSALLLIGIVTLVLFFATGVYSEKIAYAYKFVPQANRALRYFNIYLNTKKAPRKWSYSPLKLFRYSSAVNSPTATGSNSPALARTPSSASLRSSRSSTSPNSSPSRSKSPYNTSFRANAVPLAPLPPASNPRGELIFSSKVSQHYRDGYEKYRSDWEEKRRSKKQAMQSNKPSWFGAFFRSSRSTTPSSSHEENEKILKRTDAKIKGEPMPHSEYSDSSSVEPAPSTIKTRGRDSRTRPLDRSGSMSSISSITFNPSPPVSRGSSPLRETDATALPMSSRSLAKSAHISQGNINKSSDEDKSHTSSIRFPKATSASSNDSSRASTPDLIREDDENSIISYYPHNRSSSSISLSTISTSQSILIANGGNNGNPQRRKRVVAGKLIDTTVIDSMKRRGIRLEDDDDEDDDLPSPPDMSPNARIVNLPNTTGGRKRAIQEMDKHQNNTSLNDILED